MSTKQGQRIGDFDLASIVELAEQKKAALEMADKAEQTIREKREEYLKQLKEEKEELEEEKEKIEEIIFSICKNIGGHSYRTYHQEIKGKAMLPNHPRRDDKRCVSGCVFCGKIRHKYIMSNLPDNPKKESWIRDYHEEEWEETKAGFFEFIVEKRQEVMSALVKKNVQVKTLYQEYLAKESRLAEINNKLKEIEQKLYELCECFGHEVSDNRLSFLVNGIATEPGKRSWKEKCQCCGKELTYEQLIKDADLAKLKGAIKWNYSKDVIEKEVPRRDCRGCQYRPYRD